MTGGLRGKLRGPAWASAGAALMAVLLEILCLWQAAYWLGEGDRAMSQGKEREAFDAWRSAAGWNAPWNPWRDEALERLSQRSEPEAQERLRGSILGSALVPAGREAQLLETASIRLAALRPDLPKELWTEIDVKFSWWKVLAVLSLLVYIGLGYAAVRAVSGPTPQRSIKLIWILGLQLVSLALVFLGLWLAP